MSEGSGQSIKKGDILLSYIIPERIDWLYPFLYLQILILAEFMTNMVEPHLGLLFHGLALIALLIHGALDNDIRHRRFLLTLALAPLIRLQSLFLPLAGRPLIEWYLVVGSILFVAVYFTARISGLRARRIGLNLSHFLFQVLFGFVGIGLGFLEYLILRPEPLVDEFNFAVLWLPTLILTIFTGFLEELIFRGLIQEAAIASYGRFGMTFGGVLFAVLHVGHGSFLDVVFVFCVAILFGYVVIRTGSIFGVSIAHSLTNVCLFLIFPFVFR
jgi:membrane protease YdiL (CAAX protease family)